MTMLEEPDDFERYCRENNFTTEEEIAEAFATWVQDTTGYDGSQFSLTEDERHWINRANEVVEWLRTYDLTKSDEALTAALTCVRQLRPIPGSLTVD